jgi:chromate transport protein ChrA
LILIPVSIGFAVYALAQSATGAIIAGVVLGIPMLIILIFISGLYQTFESTYWTLGYRAVKG